MHRAPLGGCAGVVLDLVTEALDAIAVGRDPRPGVCRALADAVGADAAGYLSPTLRVVVRPDPARAVARRLLGLACADPRVVRVPDLYVFARADGFQPDDLAVLRCAQDPALAIERLRRRTTPAVEVLGSPAVHLTARELEVLRLLSEGLLARTIASRLAVSPRTVHHHLGSIYAKLGVSDRLSAVLSARTLGLLDAEGAGPSSTNPRRAVAT